MTRVHSVPLRFSCSFFQAILEGSWAESSAARRRPSSSIFSSSASSTTTSTAILAPSTSAVDERLDVNRPWITTSSNAECLTQHDREEEVGEDYEGGQFENPRLKSSISWEERSNGSNRDGGLNRSHLDVLSTDLASREDPEEEEAREERLGAEEDILDSAEAVGHPDLHDDASQTAPVEVQPSHTNTPVESMPKAVQSVSLPSLPTFTSPATPHIHPDSHQDSSAFPPKKSKSEYRRARSTAIPSTRCNSFSSSLRTKDDGIYASIVLPSPEARAFDGLLHHLYPHLTLTPTWTTIDELTVFAHKVGCQYMHGVAQRTYVP